MNVGVLVILAGGSLVGTGGCTRAFVATLVVVFLVLLDLLGVPLALLEQLLVLRLDLTFAVIGVAATASTASLSAKSRTGYQSIARYVDGKTHVSSTLIARGGYLPSSKVEWWYSLRQLFMRSKLSNSMKAKPRHFLLSSFLVATRMEVGGFLSKCFLTDSSFAE